MYFLLAISYGVYCFYDWHYAILLLLMTGLSYGCGVLLETKWQQNKLGLGFSIILTFLPLVVFKTLLFPGIQRETWSIVLPLGLSYYSFKSVGYLVDIYKGTTKCEHNFAMYALFVSFFPEIFIGPIDRANNLLKQIHENPVFDFGKVKIGLLLLSWGYFQKVVVADRIAIYVNAVYGDLENFSGFIILMAMLFYSLQIYMDFAGCTNIVRGMGAMLGFQLPMNFKQPYLSTSVAEFWSKWHISLTSWFRDYIYIPLGGNRKGKLRKYSNILVVFLVSGIWHGNGITFIIWGLLNGLFQVIGDCTSKLREKMYHKLHWQNEDTWLRRMKMLGTYCLISCAWTFFRADNMEQAFLVWKRLFAGFHGWELLSSKLYEFAFDYKNWHLLLLAIAMVWLVDVIEAKKKTFFMASIIEKPFVVQLLVAYVIIFAIIIFGAYGSGFEASDFIYMNF